MGCVIFLLDLIFLSNLSFLGGQKATLVVTVACMDLLNFFLIQFQHDYSNTLIHWCHKPTSSSLNDEAFKLQVITTVGGWMWTENNRTLPYDNNIYSGFSPKHPTATRYTLLLWQCFRASFSASSTMSTLSFVLLHPISPTRSTWKDQKHLGVRLHRASWWV